MRVLVTGATGFIGRHTATCLVERGHDVRALVRNLDRAQELLDKFKEKHDAWKFSRRSGQTTLDKNGKTWNWCTGPGHFGLGMWVAHEPSTGTNRNTG